MGALPKRLQHASTPDPLDILNARAEARAFLVAVGEIDLTEAVDGLQAYAMTSGLVAKYGDAFIQDILARAFSGRAAGVFYA